MIIRTNTNAKNLLICRKIFFKHFFANPRNFAVFMDLPVVINAIDLLITSRDLGHSGLNHKKFVETKRFISGRNSSFVSL